MPKGRKVIAIDWVEVDKLCAMQATLDEIAFWFECSPDTIERACKREQKCNFAEYYERKRARGKIALRRQMFQMAMKGDRQSVPIIIYLDRKFLGGLPPQGDTDTINVVTQNNVQVSAELEKYRDVSSLDLVKLLINRGECNGVQIQSPAGVHVQPETEVDEPVVVDATPSPTDFTGLQELPDGSD